MPCLSQPGMRKSSEPVPCSAKIWSSVTRNLNRLIERNPLAIRPNGWPVLLVFVRQQVPLSTEPLQCSDFVQVRCMSEKRSPENAKTKKVPRIITSWFSHSRIKILRSKCINVYSKKGVTLELT